MRTYRLSTWIAAGAVFALAGCGGSDLTVQVVADGPEGPVPQAKLPVTFYPFDRDSIFDDLDAEASSPKPEIPEAMLNTFATIRGLQEQWRSKESEWSGVRDRMQTLSDEMNAMDPRARGTREYMSKYEEFESLEGREQALNNEKTELFERFTALQDSVTAQVDSFRIVRDNWEEEAYAGYFDIEQDLLTQLKREVYEDTTSAAGYVTRRLPGGDWWVTTRIRVPVGEFYWNLKVDSDLDTLRLDSQNGEERIRL
jgi:hypothetical protein